MSLILHCFALQIQPVLLLPFLKLNLIYEWILKLCVAEEWEEWQLWVPLESES